jgi:hypothetical protein
MPTQMQKIISPVHVSFSVFGLAFILVLGILIIVTSFVLEPLAHCTQRRLGKNAYSRLEWTSTGVFQLQRLAHEALVPGPWEHCAEDIPSTAPDTMLAPLDISDENHPMLRAPETYIQGVPAAVTAEKRRSPTALVTPLADVGLTPQMSAASVAVGGTTEGEGSTSGSFVGDASTDHSRMETTISDGNPHAGATPASVSEDISPGEPPTSPIDELSLHVDCAGIVAVPSHVPLRGTLSSPESVSMEY